MWRSTLRHFYSSSVSLLRAASVHDVAVPISSRRTCARLSSDAAPRPFAENNDPAVYKQLKQDLQKLLHAKLTSPNRFQSISAREDRSEWPAAAMVRAVSPGKWMTTYRGCSILKASEDLVIRHQLFWHLKPATVIELGTFTGTMAIWMADTLKLLDIPCQIYSMDKDLSLLEERVKELKPDNVTFLQGDSNAIEKTFTPELMSQLPHPWVIAEDAHENFKGVLGHFHRFMQQGDYLVVEDTNPHESTGFTVEGDYEEIGPVLLNELRGFLQEYEDYYAVDSFYTDFYGYNGGWFWNGYIKRMN